MTGPPQGKSARKRTLRTILATLACCAVAGAVSLQAQSPLNNCSGSPLDPCTYTPAQTSGADSLSGAVNNQRSSAQVYVDSAGGSPARRSDVSPPQLPPAPPDATTDLQKLAQVSTGELLPIFGRELFQGVPSTFAPGDQIAADPSYIVGPGDVLLVRIWGSETFNGQLTVDQSGAIYLPKVGAVAVAGLRFADLQKQIETALSRTYRNFDLSVNIGTLRSIQVYVVGEARRPGAYTISSLSTVLNALFASGGPNVRGSLRHILVRRAGRETPEFDLYDFLLHGDKSKDVRLQSGDTIFIPAVGSQVALAGSVRHPAIYELKTESTIGEVLELAGGLSTTAFASSASFERIEADAVRRATRIALDPSGRASVLHDGDVLYVPSISAGYAQTVTIRGNLANPGRFAWREGMRLSDIIPDRMSLLTNDYWNERNQLGIPTPLFEPDRNTVQRPAVDGVPALSGNQEAAPGTLAESLPAKDLSAHGPRNAIQVPTPQIDWSYAVIERIDHETLKTSLIPFNLGKLVQDHDAAQNHVLRPGDVVTILSEDDLGVAQDQMTKYVRLEGEFAAAGVYSVGPNETLDQVVQRAGGLTSKAYLYGSSFSRESARVSQQQRLDEYITGLSVDLERAAIRSDDSATAALNPNALAEERNLISQIRQLRASGRIVLGFKPQSTGADSLPKLSLENGDVLRVPSRPGTVNVVGAVYGQNVFLYEQHKRLSDYLALAGKANRVSDRKHAYIIRADGSIYSRQNADGFLSSSFERTEINPGDTIVVPEKLIKPSALRQLVVYSQILSSFGLAAAAIDVLR